MYSRDDVELALYALEEGMGARGAAELVGCGVTAVREWSRGHLPHSVAGCGSLRGGCARSRPGRRTEAVAMARSDEAEDRGAGLYDAPATGPLSGLSPDQVENRLLRAVLDDLKGAGSHPASMSNRRKCELGERLRAATGLPLHEITAFLRISKSSYEYWGRRLADGSACAPDEADELGGEVERVFREEGRCARGYRFVHARLAEELGRPVSEKVVREHSPTVNSIPVVKNADRSIVFYLFFVNTEPHSTYWPMPTLISEQISCLALSKISVIRFWNLAEK